MAKPQDVVDEVLAPYHMWDMAVLGERGWGRDMAATAFAFRVGRSRVPATD